MTVCAVAHENIQFGLPAVRRFRNQLLMMHHHTYISDIGLIDILRVLLRLLVVLIGHVRL